MPNILFIMADDLGWMDTSVYGSRFYETPSIDRLATEGMRFTDAYSASPLCAPTRASVATGLSPARIGITAPQTHLPEVNFVQDLRNPPPEYGYQVNSSVTRFHHFYYTLAEAFADLGYATAHFGKWHLGMTPYSPLEQGYAVDIPHWHGSGPSGSYLAPWGWPATLYDKGKPGEHIDDRLAEETIRFMRRHQDKPFFIQYWPFSVHSPYHAEKDVKAEQLEKYIPLAREKHAEGYPQHNAVMGGMVETMDQTIGRVLDELDALGLRDSTIVVLYSDNGGVIVPPRESYLHPEPVGPITSNHPLRSGKGSVYEGGVRVPLIVRWPGVTEPGSVSDSIVSSNDFFPTFLEMVGAEAPPGLRFDGRSFVPSLRGEADPRPDFHVHFPHGIKDWEGFQPATTLRRGDWKLIRFYADGPGQEDRLELYNLCEDVGERNNLAARHPEATLELNRALEDFLRESGASVPGPNPRFDPAVARERWADGEWRSPFYADPGALFIDSWKN